jgi:carboxyl-terminal processing protease
MKKPMYKHFLFAIILAVIFGAGFASGTVKGRDTFAQSVKDVDMTEFWRVWEIVQSKYVPTHGGDPITPDSMMEGAVQGLVDSLGDPYSVYFTPEENKSFREAIEGNFEGVGMEVGIANGVLTVVAPLKDTPAGRSGIMPGDIILEIDGETAAKLTVDEAVARIRGEVDTEVILNVFRPSTKEDIEIVMVRAVINIPVLETDIVDNDIFVITLYNFTGSIREDFDNAMTVFRQSRKTKLILDLRGNPGGYLSAAIDVSSYFLPKGTVVVKEDFGSNTRSLRSTGKGYDGREIDMIVLTNGGSASASEIVAGALSQHGVATIVGTKTFGKGSVQELISISGETSLKLTIARWLTPDDTSLSENGLNPDVEVEISKEDTEAGIDTQLEKAKELLLE